MGVDAEGVRIIDANILGATGGQAVHALSVDQLPLYEHDKDELTIQHAGEHTHGVHDPGHTHHIAHALIAGYGENSGPYGVTWNKWLRHVTPDTEKSNTGINIHSSGSHVHQITGRTASTGGGQQFSLLQSFQTFNYIIYTGE